MTPIAMQKVIKASRIPNESIILKYFGKVDYCDTYQVNKTIVDTVDNVTTEIFRTPKWIKLLMQIRNSIVRLFGLRTGDMNESNIERYYPVGSKAVYFTVIDRTDYEIVMAENDKHLNFRASILIDRKGKYSTINLSTVVKFNNTLGRFYFMLIKPFHRVIVKSLLKRYAK